MNILNIYAYRAIRDSLDCAIINLDIDKLEEIADEVISCSELSLVNMLTSVQKRYIIKRAVISGCNIELRISRGELSPLQVPKSLKKGSSKFYILYIERYLQRLSIINPEKATALAKKVMKDILNNPYVPFPKQWDCFLRRIIKR